MTKLIFCSTIIIFRTGTIETAKFYFFYGVNVMDSILLELNKGELIYEQIYRHIRGEILAGKIVSGERLPSKRSLAKHLGVSINSVDTAYGMLVAEGYINSKERSGYYACSVVSGQIIAPSRAVSNRLQSGKKSIYNFGTSSIDSALFPFKLWCRIEREVLGDEQLLNHGDRQGDYNLRHVISRYLRAYRGVDCDANEIVIGAGIDYLLCLVARMFEGSCVAVEEPGYGRAERVFRDFGTSTVHIPLDQDGMSISDLDKSLAQLAYITPSCQFPTGITMPVRRRQEMLAWAEAREGRYIIEDDYNSEFRFSGRPIPALKSHDINGRVVHVGTFSKSVAPSLRIAYMVLPPKLHEEWGKKFGVYACTVSRFEQQALYRFIEGGHFSRHINRLRNTCKKRRDCLITALKTCFKDKVTISVAEAGLHIVVDFHLPLSEDEMLNAASNNGLTLLSMNDFHHGKTRKSSCRLILGFSAMTEQQIIKAVELLKISFNRE